MPKYSYNVINEENKALSGTISAPDEQSARNELNQLGFSVVGITEIPENQAAEAQQGPVLPIFEFAGIDKNQKRVVGTIQAEDRLAAYKRLISEYSFEVEYLVEQSLLESQKNEEKLKGVFELQNQVDEEALANQKKVENKDMKEFEAKQEVLKDQVDFVLKKVSEMLNLYETEMKPEIKIEIRKYVDKVLRIKSSTNLDYIRKTCEELLTYLQQEEIFLHQENKQNERTQMVMQAKTMMMQLHSNKNTSGMDIGELLRTWRQEHILNNPQPNTLEKSLNFLASLVIGFAPENKEITELRHDLNIIGAQVWQYWQLYFQATTPEYKTEARNSLKKLSLEKKKLKLQLKEAKKRLHEEFNKNNEITPLEKFNLELLSFTGWLLGFYLAYYFISIYLNTKQLGIAWLPVPFSIYKTNFLKYFLTTIFLFHSSLSVKLNFFRRNEVATLVITPVFLLSTLLIILNF